VACRDQPKYAQLTLSKRSLPNPAQLKRYRKLFSVGLFCEISRANVVSFRTVPQRPNGAQILFGIKGALDAPWSGTMRTTLNGEVIASHDNFEFPWSHSGDVNRSMKGLLSKTTVVHRFFFLDPRAVWFY
jgi:hypothetical protein